MQQPELIPHLFRTEFRKITSVLCKHFGIDHIETAEDIASETFLAAIETWTYKGIPPAPVAWLYTVAKNKAKNYISRSNTLTQKIIADLQETESAITNPDIDLSEKNITDSQLQMLFAICHPGIAPEAQIGLSLRILCGFGIDEIANAFLSNKETINKRLFRAKEKLRMDKVPIGLPAPDEIHSRLNTVLATLYLLFNEGYYSESNDIVLREDLCREAMRLTALLLDNETTRTNAVQALYALMCFHASRFAARTGTNGEMILYNDQDEALWDQALISTGAYHLQAASTGNTISKYHLEACIAYWHTIKTDTPEKWDNILQLYNQLLQVAYSPVAALNRTFALFKVNGRQAAIVEAEKLQLTDNHYYYTLLGELYKDIDPRKAATNYTRALELAKSNADKNTIRKKMELLNVN